MKRVLATLLIALGACSQGPGEEPTDDIPFSVETGGELGSPTITTVSGELPSEQTRLVEEGNGKAITADSTILYTATSFDDDGQVLAGGDLILGPAEESPLETIGEREGSRIIEVNPQEGGVEIIVLDLLYTTAHGEDREITGEPTIQVNEAGVPELSGPGTVNSLRTTIAIRGTGPQIAAEDEVYVQYSLYDASTGDLLDSTWEQGPILLDLEGTMEGIRTGVTETPVGSRLLIKIPAGQAQGTRDLIAIVDTLAIN